MLGSRKRKNQPPQGWVLSVGLLTHRRHINLEKPDSANYCLLITYINDSDFTTAFWKHKKLSTKTFRQAAVRPLAVPRAC